MDGGASEYSARMDLRTGLRLVRAFTHPLAVLPVLLGLGFFAANPAVAVDISWINPAGGLWSNPANWSAGAVPGPADRAFIDLAGNYTVTLDTDAYVLSLALGAGSGTQMLSASGRTFSATENVSIGSGAVLEVANSVINAPLENRGQVVAQYSNSINGALTTEAGSTLRVDAVGPSGSTLTVGPVTNRGTIELTSASGYNAFLSGAGPLTNAAGGVISVLAGGGGGRYLRVPLDNQGTVSLETTLYSDQSGVSVSVL